MLRPYGDPAEIVAGPVTAQSPVIPMDAEILVGAIGPASPDAIPIVLLPGFEYRMLEWRHPGDGACPPSPGRGRAAREGHGVVPEPSPARPVGAGSAPR